MARGEVVIVGSGPNGLAAAATMARAGWRPVVLEAEDRIGGGTRTEALTTAGFLHDVCATVHPMGAASECFRELDLASRGLAWVHPPAPLAHPFDDGTAALLERSTAATGETLDRADRHAWTDLFRPFVDDADAVLGDALGPPLHLPPRSWRLPRLGALGIRSAAGLASARFRGARGRALFGGIAAHTLSPIDHPLTAAFGPILGLAGHAVGWPFARGGSRAIADALASIVTDAGGRIETGRRVRSLAELPPADATFLDVGPPQLLDMAGDRLPRLYRWLLARYRYGPGVCKVDWALREPIPWTAAACARAGTVHLGGTIEEIRASTRAAWDGRPDARPFVLLTQPTRFDGTRAPAGAHTAWAYCHVPHGSPRDMTAAIEAQVERFAPGFRDLVIDRHTFTATQIEAHNANLVGGDINGGVQDIRQLLARPVPRLRPWVTPIRGVYLCSASTPPGGAVHGMCGWHAAHAALARLGSGG